MAEYARSKSRRKPTYDCCAQRERENFKKFKALIATPGNLVSGVSLPANADVYVSSSSVLAAVTLLVDAIGPEGTRNLGVPISVANDPHHIGRLYRATTVKKHTAAPGTVSVYMRNDLGHLFLFAQG